MRAVIGPVLKRGKSMRQLLYYLHEPGQTGEHVNPHLVGGRRCGWALEELGGRPSTVPVKLSYGREGHGWDSEGRAPSSYLPSSWFTYICLTHH